MPTLVTTIEDNSPLVLYTGWTPGTSADTSIDLYRSLFRPLGLV